MCKSRLMEVEDAFRLPIILPSSHVLFTRSHRRCSHAGAQTLLSILRDKYWIFRGRQKVRKFVTRCVICQKHKVKSAQSPPEPLPLERTRAVAVFEIAGVDLADPLFLRDSTKV